MGELKNLMENAKRLYELHTSNHPTIHINRFPTWEELDQNEKNKWLATAKVKT